MRKSVSQCGGCGLTVADGPLATSIWKGHAERAESINADLLAALRDTVNDLEEIYQKRQPRIDYKVKGVADRLSATIARPEETT